MVVRSINSYERQQAIWHHLCDVRQITAESLAQQFSTTIRMIYRDMQELMLTHPIESIPGKYGGYKLMGWYLPSRTRLCSEQIEALKRAIQRSDGEDCVTLTSILR